MKISTTILLLLTTVLSACSPPGVIVREYMDEEIIHYSKMYEYSDMSPYVFYLNEGDEINVIITADSGLVELVNTDTKLVLKKKVYYQLIMPEGIDLKTLSTSDEEDQSEIFKNLVIYLSPDAKQWAHYGDIDTVQQLFGIKGGSISLGIGASKEDGIELKINASTLKSNSDRQ